MAIEVPCEQSVNLDVPEMSAIDELGSDIPSFQQLKRLLEPHFSEISDAEPFDVLVEAITYIRSLQQQLLEENRNVTP